MFNNKKGFLGKLILVFVSVLFMFAVYPFWSQMIQEAANIHTGIIKSAIEFIPFIVLLMIIVSVINLDVGTTT